MNRKVFNDGVVSFREYAGRGILDHRDRGPALISPDGAVSFFTHGRCNRDDGPAAIWPDGTKRYYQNGVSVLPEEYFLLKGKL